MLKKCVTLAVVLMIVGLAVVSAQQPVPKPPTPNFVTVLGRNPSGSPFSQTQIQRLFEIYDQQNYDQYLRNCGFITQDVYDQRRDKFFEDLYATANLDTSGSGDIQGEIREAIEKLWVNWSPGWHGQAIRECIGFALQQPQGTRATSQNENNRMIRMNLTPLTDQIFNNIKQQLETGLGATMTYEADFNRYTYVLRSNRSASGKPYYIEVARRSDGSVYIEISELVRDP